VPVDGVVTLDDQPLKQMVIIFTPTGETKGTGALGYTGEDGRFKLVDSRNEAGAYVGDYVVYFYPAASPEVQADPSLDVVSTPKRGGFPAIYLEPETTPLKATVPKGGGSIEVKLTRSGKGATTKTTPAGGG
jgi:hypothetical protein